MTARTTSTAAASASSTTSPTTTATDRPLPLPLPLPLPRLGILTTTHPATGPRTTVVPAARTLEPTA